MKHNLEQEKRSSDRKAFNKPVYLELSVIEKDTPKVVKLTGKGVNISHTGIGLITKYSLKKGSVVRLIIPIEEVGTSFSTFAKTVWAQRINGSYRAGLHFLM
ncbi:PilZ domain-containing protein [Desulfovulcanus sp.]